MNSGEPKVRRPPVWTLGPDTRILLALLAPGGEEIQMWMSSFPVHDASPYACCSFAGAHWGRVQTQVHVKLVCVCFVIVSDVELIQIIPSLWVQGIAVDCSGCRRL